MSFLSSFLTLPKIVPSCSFSETFLSLPCGRCNKNCKQCALELPAGEIEEEDIYSQTPLLPFTKGSFRSTRMAERFPKGIPCGDRRKFWQKARESCCNLQTKCCQATPFYSLLWQQFWKQRVSQEDVRGDIKDVQSGLEVLDPIPICMCMWWCWFLTLPSNSQVQLGVLQFN